MKGCCTAEEIFSSRRARGRKLTGGSAKPKNLRSHDSHLPLNLGGASSVSGHARSTPSSRIPADFTGRSGDRELCERERISCFGEPKQEIFSSRRARGCKLGAAANPKNLGSHDSRSPDLPVSRSGQSPACWTESTEAYGPSRRRGSAEGAVNLEGSRHERSGWKEPQTCRPVRLMDDTRAAR